MSDSLLKLANAPIVEAVVDIDCDLPAGFDLAASGNLLQDQFQDPYPKVRTQFLEQHRIEREGDQPPKVSARRGVQAFQFLQEHERQLVQVRAQGFSFNRLAPYTSLDDYLPEIERTWHLFRSLISPIQIRAVRLRYINRILLPLADGKIKVDEYLRLSPQLPDQMNLTLVGFLNQHLAVEVGTGHQANIVLSVQQSEKDKLPVILDICVASPEAGEPDNWPWLLEKIQSLRALKNRIFRNTLTEPCLNLFQQSDSATSPGMPR